MTERNQPGPHPQSLSTPGLSTAGLSISTVVKMLNTRFGDGWSFDIVEHNLLSETVEVVEIGRFVYFDVNLDGAPVRFVVEPAYTARKDDEGLIYIQSLDKATAEFYDTLDLQREANINPFVEPVFLNSNVEGAIGIFGAVARSVPVRFVFPQDAL